MKNKSINTNPLLPYKGGFIQFESRPITVENGIVSNKIGKDDSIKRMMADRK